MSTHPSTNRVARVSFDPSEDVVDIPIPDAPVFVNQDEYNNAFEVFMIWLNNENTVGEATWSKQYIQDTAAKLAACPRFYGTGGRFTPTNVQYGIQALQRASEKGGGRAVFLDKLVNIDEKPEQMQHATGATMASASHSQAVLFCLSVDNHNIGDAKQVLSLRSVCTTNMLKIASVGGPARIKHVGRLAAVLIYAECKKRLNTSFLTELRLAVMYAKAVYDANGQHRAKLTVQYLYDFQFTVDLCYLCGGMPPIRYVNFGRVATIKGLVDYELQNRAIFNNWNQLVTDTLRDGDWQEQWLKKGRYYLPEQFEYIDGSAVGGPLRPFSMVDIVEDDGVWHKLENAATFYSHVVNN